MRGLALLVSVCLASLAGAAKSHATSTRDSPMLSRGRYLTRLGDCRACHTRPGHPAFAGGRAIKTPFGVIYTPNITPDKVTGIGNWSGEDFYRALHEGISANGDFLYPAFPFPAYTRLRRKDVEAIRTYLGSIKPVRQANREPRLRWPYNYRFGLRLWRALYFDAGTYTDRPDHNEHWNRGAYLVKGLAHCGSCHTPRNRLGAKIDSKALNGGTVPIDGWIAPDITSPPGDDVVAWPAGTLKNFLVTGQSRRGDAFGAMRDVVQSSLRYLESEDADAIVTYLRSLPPGEEHAKKTPTRRTTSVADKRARSQGQSRYRKHCADCHGKRGRAPHSYYPNLRDSRVVLSDNPTNLILIILRGGFQARTRANPYPHSMPPFAVLLGDNEIANIANYVRQNWQNRPRKTLRPRQIGALR